MPPLNFLFFYYLSSSNFKILVFIYKILFFLPFTSFLFYFLFSKWWIHLSIRLNFSDYIKKKFIPFIVKSWIRRWIHHRKFMVCAAFFSYRRQSLHSKIFWHFDNYRWNHLLTLDYVAPRKSWQWMVSSKGQHWKLVKGIKCL